MRPVSLTSLLAVAALAALALSGCASSSGTMTVQATDAPDNIGDFSSLTVTVTKITVLGADGGSHDYSPSKDSFDLTKLQNENTTTLFSGAVAAGNYTKLELKISQAKGVLKAGGQTVDVQAPSGTIFLTQHFEVAKGKETVFVFDVQVHIQGNGDYMLKHNASGSKVHDA